MSAGSVCAVVVGMVAINDDVRENLASVLNSDRSRDLAMIGARAQGVTRVVTQVVGSYGSEHAVLVGFGCVALVLVVCMLRT
jgi:hypothetical protein